MILCPLFRTLFCKQCRSGVFHGVLCFLRHITGNLSARTLPRCETHAEEWSKGAATLAIKRDLEASYEFEVLLGNSEFKLITVEHLAA